MMVKDAMNFTLDENEKAILLRNARESIESALERRQPAYPPSTANLKTRAGAFVTLRTKSGSLRGCIGTIVGRAPLDESIRETARSSAFQDFRFKPVEREDWQDIEIEISVLTPLARVESVSAIVPGLHGVYLRKGANSGIFLPQVASEQGWDRDELLAHLCAKAGLPADAWKSSDAEISVFTALVFAEKSRDE